jgi:hypothetical protein
VNRAPLPAPTEQDLRDAWQRCRIAAWPSTFEETMVDPARAALVRINASRARRDSMKPRRQLSAPACRPLLPGIPSRFDRKRAAAGDRDDD